MKTDFYNRLTEGDKQICDLCKDWSLGECEKCEFTSRYLPDNNDKEECYIDSKEKRRHD